MKSPHPSSQAPGEALPLDIEKISYFNIDTITIAGVARDKIRATFSANLRVSGGRNVNTVLERVYDLEEDLELAKKARELLDLIKQRIRKEHVPDVYRQNLCESCMTSNCCRTYAPIWMTESDVLRMESVLKKSRQQLAKDGNIVLNASHWTGDFVAHLGYIDTPYHNVCVNLDTSRKPHRCKIYEARPEPCRAYKAFGCTLYEGTEVPPCDVQQHRSLIGDDP